MKVLAYILILFISLVANAESVVDSLENELLIAKDRDKVVLLNKISDYYKYKDSYKAIEYAKQSIELSISKKILSAEYESYIIIGETYKHINELSFAIEYFNKAYEIVENIKLNKKVAEIALKLGVAYRLSSQYDKSIEYLQIAQKAFLENSNDELLAETYNNLGLVFLKISYYEKALNFFYDALNLYEQMNEPNNGSKMYNNIGMVYYKNKDYEKSIVYYNKALSEKNIESDSISYSNSLNNIGCSYNQLKQHDQAQVFFYKSLNIRIKKNDKKGISTSYNNIANIFEIENRYDSALIYHLKSLEIKETLDDKYAIALSNANVGNVYNHLNKYKLAQSYLTKASEIGELIKAKDILEFTYEKLFDNCMLRGDSKNAYYYKTKYYSIKEEVKEERNKQKINELRIFYENDSKEKELAFLINQKELQALSLNEKSKISVVLTIIFVLTLIIALLILFVFRRSRGVNRKLLQDDDISNALLDISEDLIALVDSTGKILKVNQSLSNILKSEMSDLKGKSMFELFSNNTSESRKRNIKLILESKRPYHYEEEYNNKIYDTCIYPIDSSYGYVTRFAMYACDITKERRTLNELGKKNKVLEKSQQRLNVLNKTKDKLFSIISHDLKNPFNTILGFSEILANNYNSFDKEKIKSFSKIINESAEQLYNLLENLLQWSNTQTKKYQFNPEHFNFHKISNEIIKLVLISASQKKISIESDIDDKTSVYGDKNMISTVLRNLCQNAVKFTNYGGTITIQTTVINTMLEVKVSDDGVGMSVESMEKIFKLDSNYSTSGTANEKGTGLGLIICKEFVDKNSGVIWVESQIDKGSDFYFTLPLSKLAT